MVRQVFYFSYGNIVAVISEQMVLQLLYFAVKGERKVD